MERESFEDARDGGAHERALRLDQGRPRGASRPRRDLHGRRAGDDAASGGWPLTAFLTPQGEPFYAGHVLPERGSPRHAGVPPGPRRRSPRRGATRRDEAESTGHGASSRRSRGPASSAASHDPLSEDVLLQELSQGLRAGVRHAMGRLRRRAEVPAADDARVPAAVRTSAAVPGALDMVDAHARPHGRRRHATTRSAAASTATRPTSDGSCRTSRRCSTTTRSSRACTRARGRSPGSSATASSRRGPCDYLLREMQHPERRRSSPRRTPTPRASRAVPSSGRGTSSSARSASRSRPRSARRRAATGRARTSCGSPHPIAAVADELELDAAELERDLEAARATLLRDPRRTRAPGDRRQGPRRRGTGSPSRPSRRPAARSASPRTSRPPCAPRTSSSRACGTARGGSCGRGERAA